MIDDLGEPIVDAYVSTADYKIHTRTDSAGKFLIHLKPSQNEIIVLHTDYQKKIISIKPSIESEVVIKLKKINFLDEIVVIRSKKRLRKKENPAYPILKKIWNRRKINGLELEDIYEYQKLSSIEFGGDFSKELVKNLSIFKDKDTLSKYMIKKKRNDYDKYETPLNLKQIIERHYVNNKLGKHRTDILFKKDVRAFKSNSFFYEKFQEAFEKVNIYKNTLSILDNQFESPVSKTGFSVYNYTLIDSLYIDGHKHYKIEFYPKNPSSLAFEGSFEVSSPSYSITDIQMSTLKDLNANFIKKMTFRKIFTIKNDSVYLPKNNFSRIELSISRNDQATTLYIKKKISYSEYIFDNEKPKKFYNEKPKKNSNKEINKYKLLDSVSSEANQKVELVIKALQKNKKIQFGANIIDVLSFGYIPITDYIHMGNILGFYTYNGIEGSRYNIGFRTFKNINDRFRTYFYYGYGVRNRRSNFGISSSYMIFKNPGIRLGSYYIDDLQVFSNKFGGSQGVFSQAAAGLVVLRSDNFISKVRSFGLKAQISITENFRLGVSISKKYLSSANQSLFNVSYLDQGKTISEYNTSPVNLSLRYTPRRKVLGSGVEQDLILNRYPSFSIAYSNNTKGFLKSNLNYHKLQFQYNYPLILGRFGVLEHSVRAGKTFGTLPVLLLNPVSSNTTALSTRQGFTNMNQYDFVMDLYAYGNIEHHFNGYIFNKIPLLNKLRVRSVAIFNIVYGSISNKNIKANTSSITYNTPSPYYEYGFGIENIGIGTIRIFRINFIWRGPLPQNFVRNTTNDNPKFGIQLQLQQIGF